VNEPVTVEVRPNGQVWVNGILVAEVSVPRPSHPEGVFPRDELAHELVLHRMVATTADALTRLVRYAVNGKMSGDPGRPTQLDDTDRADWGVAFLAGLAGDPGELTGRAFYRDGHRAGNMLRSLHDSLANATGDPTYEIGQAAGH